MNIFHFFADDTIIKIKLAIAYEPSILKNYIEIRPYNAFLYIIEGTYKYISKNSEFIAESNSLIYLPAQSEPYEYHIEKVSAEVRCMQIEFEASDAKTALPLSFSDTPLLLDSTPDNGVKKTIENIINSFNLSNPVDQLLSYSYLYSLLAHYASYATQSSRSLELLRIHPAISYIESRLSEKPSSAKLASLCSLSESQLRRIFKSALGKSPLEYRKLIILKKAKELLLLGELQIGAIADILGFYDIYAFSHFFIKEVGIPPSKYLKNL